MLTRKHRLAIYMLINGYSNAEISAELSVHPSTVRWWMNKNPEFAQTLKDETEYAMERARAQAQSVVRRVADNACAGLRAMQTILLRDQTNAKVVEQCTKTMVQCMVKLAGFLKQPAVVPLLESDHPDDAVIPNQSDAGETASEDDENEDHEKSQSADSDSNRAAAVSAQAPETENDAEPNDPGPLLCDTLSDEELTRLSVLNRKFGEDETADGEDSGNPPDEKIRASGEE